MDVYKGRMQAAHDKPTSNPARLNYFINQWQARSEIEGNYNRHALQTLFSGTEMDPTDEWARDDAQAIYDFSLVFINFYLLFHILLHISHSEEELSILVDGDSTILEMLVQLLVSRTTFSDCCATRWRRRSF